MNTKKDIHVSDTAFVTCAFRRLNEDLSRDPYAKLWCNEKAETILKDYLLKVSTEEIDTHCIRNRYFLEVLENVVSSKKIQVLINFGAGFSMYPFLLDDGMEQIEIDKPEVVQLKSEATELWMQEGKLPKRKVTYLGVDFSTDYQEELIKNIKKLVGKKSCFILIEGVLFFLNRPQTESIFQCFNAIQKTGDYIGSVSYTEDILKTDAYKRLLKYANKELDDASIDGFQCIEDSFYTNLHNYTLTDHQDYFSCAKTFGHSPKNKVTDILNEHFYCLQKQ